MSDDTAPNGASGAEGKENLDFIRSIIKRDTESGR
jgi:hypothetical protein